MFGKKKIQELEKKLRLKDQEITSLKSDLKLLERESFELRVKFEPNKAPGQIKSAERAMHLNTRGKAVETQITATKNVISRNGIASQSRVDSSSDFISGVALGAVGASFFSDESSCNHDE